MEDEDPTRHPLEPSPAQGDALSGARAAPCLARAGAAAEPGPPTSGQLAVQRQENVRTNGEPGPEHTTSPQMVQFMDMASGNGEPVEQKATGSGPSRSTALSSIQTSSSGGGSSTGRPYSPRHKPWHHSSLALSTFQSAPAVPGTRMAALSHRPATEQFQNAVANTSGTVERMRSMGLQYRPEFWLNLPRTSKLYLIQSCINVVLVITLVFIDLSEANQVCNCGDAYSVELQYIHQCPPALRGSCYWAPQPIYMGLIVFTLTTFYTAFTFSALVYENAHGLVASVALLVVLMGLVIFYTAQQNLDGELSVAAILIGVLAGIWCVMLMVLALASYRQMGWRMYSKCAADVRVKDATKLRDLHLLAHRYTTWIKLDIMTVLLVTLTTVTVWIELPVFAEGSSPSLVISFVLWPLIGLLVNIAWIAMCWMAVRKERLSLGIYVSYGVIVVSAYAIASLVVLIVTFNGAGNSLSDLGISDEEQSDIIARGHISLAFVGILTCCLIGMRVQCWWGMRTIHRRYGLSKKGQTVVEEVAPALGQAKSMLVPPAAKDNTNHSRPIHPSLTPLIRGAWIGKPSVSNRLKKRFFQLSHDGTTLRWAWNKYILLLYVEDVLEDDSFMELRLTITAEPDLVLRFMDMGSYEAWRNGLQTLISLLLGPDGMDASPLTLNRMDTTYWVGLTAKHLEVGALEQSTGAVANSTGPPPDSSRRPNNLGQALVGFVTQSQRASVADPDGVNIKMDREEATRRLQLSMEMSRSFMSSGTPNGSDHSSEARKSKERPRAIRTSSAPAGVMEEEVARVMADIASPEREDKTSHEDAHTSPNGNGSGQLSFVPLSPIQEKPESPQGRREICSPDAGYVLAKANSFGGFGGTHRRQQVTPEKAKSPVAGGDNKLVEREHCPVLATGNGTPGQSSSPLVERGQGETGSSGTAMEGTSTAPGTHMTGASSYPTVGAVSLSQLNPDESIADQLGLSGRVDDVEPEDLQLGKFLGAGAEGVVFAAWFNDSPVAVKKTNNVSEVQLHVLAGSHDNIVSARGVMLNEGELHLVMEYCPRGTLDTMIHHTMKGGAKAGPGWDPVKVLLPMARGIARGLLHLHKRSNPILHRDLKPGNIFVGHGLVMKLGDFGMSRQVQGRTTAIDQTLQRTFTSGVVGTSVYSAPEILGGTLDNEVMDSDTMLKADVYSFGITLWEILARKRPFDGLDHFEIQTAWIINPEDMQLPGIKVDSSLEPHAAGIMADLARLVVDCTAITPASRPAAKEIVARLKKAGQRAK